MHTHFFYSIKMSTAARDTSCHQVKKSKFRGGNTRADLKIQTQKYIMGLMQNCGISQFKWRYHSFVLSPWIMEHHDKALVNKSHFWQLYAMGCTGTDIEPQAWHLNNTGYGKQASGKRTTKSSTGTVLLRIHRRAKCNGSQRTVSISDKKPQCKILQSLETTRFVFRIFQLPLNLARSWTAMLLCRLPSFKAIWIFNMQSHGFSSILLTSFYDKAFSQILKRAPERLETKTGSQRTVESPTARRNYVGKNNGLVLHGTQSTSSIIPQFQ